MRGRKGLSGGFEEGSGSRASLRDDEEPAERRPGQPEQNCEPDRASRALASTRARVGIGLSWKRGQLKARASEPRVALESVWSSSGVGGQGSLSNSNTLTRALQSGSGSRPVRNPPPQDTTMPPRVLQPVSHSTHSSIQTQSHPQVPLQHSSLLNPPSDSDPESHPDLLPDHQHHHPHPITLSPSPSHSTQPNPTNHSQHPPPPSRLSLPCPTSPPSSSASQPSSHSNSIPIPPPPTSPLHHPAHAPEQHSHTSPAARPASLSSSHSGWWSWSLPSASLRSPLPSLPPSSEPDRHSLASEPSLARPPSPTMTDHRPYSAHISSWLSSWYAPADPPPAAPTPLANPVAATIDASSRGWAGYLSSRSALPTRKIPETEQRSVESMEVDFGSLPSSTDAQPAAGPSRASHDPAPQRSESIAAVTGSPQKAPNLLLPTFEDTFHTPPRSFQPLRSPLDHTLGLVQAYLFSAPPQFPQTVGPELDRRRRRVREVFASNKHPSTRLPKSLALLGVDALARLGRVQKVSVIGIHGWFPGPWLESVVGKPTGTSHKFAKMMDTALLRYVEQRLGMRPGPGWATVIALEGEGLVADRVERLYGALQRRDDWLRAVREADAVFVVSHSQGSLVSARLIERLINQDGVRGDRVLALCMCGIWNGPFVGLNNSYAFQPMLKLLEGPAAHELFEFQDQRSKASRAVRGSLESCLSLGVKFVLVGSMNDDVVPLYSALHTPLDHPGILRAVFVDGAVHGATDFVVALVVLCVRLRNAGLSDHALVAHLSEAVRGSLGGLGHSSVYEHNDVYDLAARYMFETSSTLDPPTTTLSSSSSVPRRLAPNLVSLDATFHPKATQNGFVLPWCLRGLVEDRQVELLFGKMVREVRELFDEWKPSGKLARELRGKLEVLKIDCQGLEEQNHHQDHQKKKK